MAAGPAPASGPPPPPQTDGSKFTAAPVINPALSGTGKFTARAAPFGSTIRQGQGRLGLSIRVASFAGRQIAFVVGRHPADVLRVHANAVRHDGKGGVGGRPRALDAQQAEMNGCPIMAEIDPMLQIAPAVLSRIISLMASRIRK